MPGVPDLSLSLAAAAGYALGSFPTAFLVVRMKGKGDIRRAGSGNVGALNSYQVTGSRYVGLLVLVTDLLKGVAAPVLAGLIAPGSGFEGAALGGIAAVAGHNFPVWLHFRGGRGLATAAGVLLVLCWPVVPAWVAAWGAGYLLTRQVNPGNVIASLLILLLVLALPAPVLREILPPGTDVGSFRFFSVFLVAIILVRHIGPMKEYVAERREKRGGE